MTETERNGDDREVDDFQPSSPPGFKACCLIIAIFFCVMCGTLLVGCNTIINSLNLEGVYPILQ